jgi:hypothetical protein
MIVIGVRVSGARACVRERVDFRLRRAWMVRNCKEDIQEEKTFYRVF